MTLLHPEFRWNAQTYTKERLIALAQKYISSKDKHLQHIGNFFCDWFDDSPLIEVQTSGSTGSPKRITVQKQRMINSAIATGHFFELPAQTTALLCMPATYIAGKLMLVRAMVLGWHLDNVQPQASPFAVSGKQYDFGAITPYQLRHSLGDLVRVKKIIVGGGSVSEGLRAAIQYLPTAIYETYGMTETLTHIAARPINHLNPSSEKPAFKIMEGVSIQQDDRQCLVIKAPKVAEQPVVTNDIVLLKNAAEFWLKGRYDNIINSGGIKVQPEEVERHLADLISNRFFISSLPDDDLGEKIVLCIEGDFSTEQLSILKDNIAQLSTLERYKKPKSIRVIAHFIETHSGKLSRKKTVQHLKKGVK